MITKLNDLYEIKGKEFFNKLLSLHVTISEKVSGSFFAFEKEPDEFIYYNKNSQLTKIERLLNRYYEDPITYIESLPNEIKKQIPENIKFCFQYFTDRSPNFISYDRLPKNNLVLTHVVINCDKHVCENIGPVDIGKFAKLLNVSVIHPIFDGTLGEDQKNRIVEYLTLTREDIAKRFKTQSFTRFIIGVLNPSLGNTFLNDDIEKPIDSIIFNFQNQTQNIYAKLVDPIIEEIISKNKNDENKDKNEIISIIYSDMVEFMESELPNLNNNFLQSTRYDERYIELISKCFNKFINRYNKRYENVEIPKQKFLKKKEFDLNQQFITNQRTFELVNKSKSFRELFKIFIMLFKKKKNDKDEYLWSNVVKFQNEIVNVIDKTIMSIKEMEFPTFKEFLMFDEESVFVNEDEIVFEEEYKAEFINEEEIQNSNDSIKHMQMIGFWQNILKKENKEVKEIKNKPEVNLIIGKFQPFHNGHLKVCESLYKENKKPVVIVQINQDKLTENTILNNKFSNEMFDKLQEKYPKILKRHLIFKNKDFSEIIEVLHEKYNIKNISCKENYQNSLIKEVDYDLYEKKLNLNGKFEFKRYNAEEIKTESYKSKIIRKSLKDNDYQKFKNMVPECLHSLFYKIKEQ